jgi:hypothetical protein
VYFKSFHIKDLRSSCVTPKKHPNFSPQKNSTPKPDSTALLLSGFAFLGHLARFPIRLGPPTDQPPSSPLSGGKPHI